MTLLHLNIRRAFTLRLKVAIEIMTGLPETGTLTDSGSKRSEKKKKKKKKDHIAIRTHKISPFPICSLSSDEDMKIYLEKKGEQPRTEAAHIG